MESIDTTWNHFVQLNPIVIHPFPPTTPFYYRVCCLQYKIVCFCFILQATNVWRLGNEANSYLCLHIGQPLVVAASRNHIMSYFAHVTVICVYVGQPGHEQLIIPLLGWKSFAIMPILTHLFHTIIAPQLSHIPSVHSYSSSLIANIASFLGPTQLSIAFSTEKQERA